MLKLLCLIGCIISAAVYGGSVIKSVDEGTEKSLVTFLDYLIMICYVALSIILVL